MRSSTSSSDKGSIWIRRIVLALAVFVLLIGALEVVARVAFPRLSRIESRIYREHEDALAMRPGEPGHPSVLLVGNSLLLDAVDPEALKEKMAPQRASRFVIENTMFIDWYYGIRRLLNEGSRPNRIVLAMDIPQLLENGYRGEYSAMYLWRTSDLVQVGREVGLDPTGISGLFFARYSVLYAERLNLRTYALNRLAPGYAQTLHLATNRTARSYTDAELIERATERLKKLRSACAEYGVEFSFLLPPGFGSGSDALMEAGRRAGIPVLIPVAQNDWDQTWFKDGVHLTPEGTARFTDILAPVLLGR